MIDEHNTRNDFQQDSHEYAHEQIMTHSLAPFLALSLFVSPR